MSELLDKESSKHTLREAPKHSIILCPTMLTSVRAKSQEPRAWESQGAHPYKKAVYSFQEQQV